jgi:hypothetical protein
MIQRGVGEIRVVSGKKLNAQLHEFTFHSIMGNYDATSHINESALNMPSVIPT